MSNPNNPIQSVYNWYRGIIRNPKYRWWIILGSLAYIFSPFDISPDFIPIIGQIDDVAILTLLLSEISQQLIDYAKNRQAEKDEKIASGINTGKTVDVDSVSVE